MVSKLHWGHPIMRSGLRTKLSLTNKGGWSKVIITLSSPGILVNTLQVVWAISLVTPGLSVRGLGAVGTSDASTIPENAKLTFDFLAHHFTDLVSDLLAPPLGFLLLLFIISSKLPSVGAWRVGTGILTVSKVTKLRKKYPTDLQSDYFFWNRNS